MNSDNVGLNPHHLFKKGITNTRWKCGGIMSWMQSSRHSAAHLPSFIKAQPKAILTYSSFPFLLRLTACGRVGWSGGWWSWWVVGGGSFGTSKWRQEEKLAGEGGSFSLKTEIWSQTGLTVPEDADLRSAHLYLPSLLLGLGFERVQADLGSEPGGRSAAGGWVIGLRQLHSPANTPTQSIQMYPLNITILYHMTCEKNIFQIKLFRN